MLAADTELPDSFQVLSLTVPLSGDAAGQQLNHQLQLASNPLPPPTVQPPMQLMSTVPAQHISQMGAGSGNAC